MVLWHTGSTINTSPRNDGTIDLPSILGASQNARRVDGRKHTGTSSGVSRRRPLTRRNRYGAVGLGDGTATCCNRWPRKAPQVCYGASPKCPCGCWIHAGTPQMPRRCRSTPPSSMPTGGPRATKSARSAGADHGARVGGICPSPRDANVRSRAFRGRFVGRLALTGAMAGQTHLKRLAPLQ